jgi:hypothetical protein
VASFLIDDAGRSWDAQAWALRKHLFVEDVRVSASALAVQRLGFIAVDVERALVRVRLNPALVAKAACAALFLYLRQRPDTRLAVIDLRAANTPQIATSTGAGIRQLAQLIAEAQYDVQERFRAREIDKDETGPLAFLVDTWHAAPAEERLATVLTAVATAALNRFLVLDRAHPTHDLTCVDAGTLPTYPNGWNTRVVGASVRYFPDGELAQWANSAYRRALKNRMPLLERVEAEIHWPTVGIRTHKYRRVILPHHRDDGSEAVLVAFA